MTNLAGKVVLITGASAGIGENLAHKIYAEGSKLILAARRVGELERVKGDILRQNTGGSKSIDVMEMDIGTVTSIPDKAKQALGFHNGIDVLLNNAGILNAGNVLDTSAEVDRKVMEVNYFGTLALTKALLPHMVQRKSGHIAFVGSLVGKIAFPHMASYCASKHALLAMGDSLRAEVTDDGIFITMICPGYLKTDIAKNSLTGDGSAQGTQSDDIEAGIDLDWACSRMVKAIKNQENEVVIAKPQPKLNIFYRYFYPKAYYAYVHNMSRELNEEDRRKGRKVGGH